MAPISPAEALSQRLVALTPLSQGSAVLTRLATQACALLDVSLVAMSFEPGEGPALHGAPGGDPLTACDLVHLGDLLVHAATTGTAVVVSDARTGESSALGAVLAVPLAGWEGSPDASVGVVSTAPRRWSARDIAMLETLVAAARLERALASEIAGRGALAARLRETEEALGESNERHRLLGLATNDVIYEWDVAAGALVWNETFYRTFRYATAPRASTLAWWTEQVHPEDRGALMRSLDAAIAGEGQSWSAEYRFRCGDGRYAIVLDRGHISRDGRGNALRMIGSLVDITERRWAAERLRETNETLHALIQASPMAIVASDMESSVTMWNLAAERMFGWRAGEVLGHALPLVPPEKREEFDAVRRSTLADRAVTGMETYRVHKTGARVEVSLSTALLRGEGGKPRGTMAVYTDISERRRLEEQLRHAQKMEAVGRLAGGVAHDFNNLLTAIRGFCEMVLDELPADDPHRADLGEIRKATDRATTLTRQLLAFSRRQLLEPRVLDVHAVVEELDGMLRRLVGEDIALATLPGAARSLVRADPGQIEQLIINLVVNARDAMPDGGAITIETGNVDLAAGDIRPGSAARPGPHVVLTVTDTGVGMDADTQAHVFEPFFTTKAKGKGTGLGLSTVYGIVQQSGGLVTFTSEPGSGTSFRIYLPCVADAATATAPVAATSTPRGTETILLVEDEEAVRHLARRLLQAKGYTVLEARHGADALLVVDNHAQPIHLLLTDVVMPAMNGRELAERVAPLRPEMRILYMSGYTDDDILRRGLLGRHMAFLHKPFSSDALARKVREILDR